MTRLFIVCAAALCAAYCAPAVVETSSEQTITNQQGTNQQGVTLQGTTLQGMTVQGFQFAGATLGGAALANVRVSQGGLVAEQDQATLQGTSLIGAHLYAQVHNLSVSPPATAIVEYRITNVVAEDAKYDPTNTGSTFLYTLEQWVADSSSWQPACPVDADGRRVAIPLAATWDETGARVESSTLFTMGCTTGVTAKCYRWGYRPWVTGYGDLVAVHWACTRLARADYCGNGTSHTRDGTWINVWDNLPAPGPIQAHGGGLLQLPPSGMTFEAGWSTGGAVCLSHARWTNGGDLIAQACPDRLIPPSLLGGTVCDLVSQVLGNGSTARLFNESDLNLNLDLF
jgi:hypothetical protein